MQDLTIGLPPARRPTVAIVEDVSFDVDPGQRLGIVGESGSGKSLTLRAIAGLLPRGVEVLSGRVEFDGRDLLTMPAKDRRALMGPQIAMIFQEPMTALNPVDAGRRPDRRGPAPAPGPVGEGGRRARRLDDGAHRHPGPRRGGRGRIRTSSPAACASGS